MDLATWLLAQYDADEQVARLPRCVCGHRQFIHGPQCGIIRCGCEHYDVADPAEYIDQLVLADLAAKRRIVELHSGAHECPDAGDNCGWIDGDLRPYCDTLRLFGHALRHREGYDPVWAPSDT